MFGWYNVSLLYIHLPLFLFSVQTKTSLEKPTTVFFFPCQTFSVLLTCLLNSHFLFHFLSGAFAVQYLTGYPRVEYLACVFCCGLIHLSFPWKSNLSVQTVLILCSGGFTHNLPHISWKSCFFFYAWLYTCPSGSAAYPSFILFVGWFLSVWFIM